MTNTHTLSRSLSLSLTRTHTHCHALMLSVQVKLMGGSSAAVKTSQEKDETVIVLVKRNKLKTVKKFRIKRSNPFSKIKTAFEATHKLKVAQKKKLKFYFNNVEISMTDTPNTINYVSGEIVFGIDT